MSAAEGSVDRSRVDRTTRLACVALFTFLASLAWAVPAARSAGVAVSDADRTRWAHGAMYGVIDQIEAWRILNNGLPRNLRTAGATDLETRLFSYRITARGQYVLRTEVVEPALEYATGDDLAPFLEAAGVPRPGPGSARR